MTVVGKGFLLPDDVDALVRDGGALYDRIMARDQQAFQMLYQQYGKPVYSIAYRVLQNSTLAEEVTQDAMLTVLTSLDRYAPRAGIRFVA